MSTIQRWEQVVPPRGRALADLAKLARSRGEESLARLFETALSEEMGADNSSDKIIARACATAIRNRLLVPAAWKKAVKCLASVTEGLIQKKKTGDAAVTSTLEELESALLSLSCWKFWRCPHSKQCSVVRRSARTVSSACEARQSEPLPSNPLLRSGRYGRRLADAHAAVAWLVRIIRPGKRALLTLAC